MQIGIIGAGNVGGTLGTRWARAGYRVMFGSRDPKAADLKAMVSKAGSSASAATNRQAAEDCDVLLLAVPWAAAKQTIEGLGDLSGKVLIDATNPLRPSLDGLALGTTTSASEQVAQWAPGAKVVKCFNTVGFNIMANPAFGRDRPVMFYCGDDVVAKQTVRQLAEQSGFDPEDAGPLTQARLLEPFAMLWISLALAHGFGRDIAFRLLRR